MKSQSWLKKALHIYLFNLILLVGQMTAIGGSLPSYAEDQVKPSESETTKTQDIPPGFTKEDFKIVADRDKAAEENFKRELLRNEGKAVVEYDVSTSSCKTFAANDARRMEDITKYRAVVGAQGYDEICLLRQKLNRQTGGPAIQCGGSLELIGDSSDINRQGQLSEAESEYAEKPAQEVDHIDDGEWEKKTKEAEARLAQATTEVEALRKLVPNKKQAYENARSRCEEDSFGFCSREQRNEVERLRIEYQSSVAGLAKAEATFKAAKKHHDTYGEALQKQEGNMTAAGSSMEKNDENMKASNNLSGIEDTANGEGGGLTGPVYETNEALKNAIDKYTSNAAKFAEEKIAETARLEFINSNKGDYEFYELALKEIDPNSRGGKMALSNIDVTAMASSAIKKLKCSPRRKHDSKAYHIFRAASATYIAASIGDNKSYNEMMGCIEKEVFNNKEENDQQFEAAEKALNSHTQIVDSMCMAVAPDPNNIPQINGQDILPRERVAKLKEICDASAGINCAPGQENGCAPRTRETALEMYQTALLIAQQELGDKRQLVSTAEANVEKGKKMIKATIQKILVAAALDILWAVLSKTELAQGIAANAASWPCHCAGIPLIIKSTISWAFKIYYYAKYVYYGIQLVRWTNFKRKWERKLNEAREHSHLKCNYGEALAMAGTHQEFAEKTKADAQKAFDDSRQSVLDSIAKDNLGALSGKTGYLILPKGLSDQEEKMVAKIYLEKYMKLIGKTALNLVFPSAFAANTETGNNNEQATDNAMGGSATSAKALGMAMGSSSFYHFIIKQNDHWQDQSYDASEKTESGYKKNSNPIMYCDQGSGSNCIKPDIVGMPTPETRVRLITNTVQLVQENISGMLEQLDIGVDQRDKYVMLIMQMREAMKLGEQGVDTQLSEKKVMSTASCMKKGVNGEFEIDPGCQCQNLGNCGTLQYPEFGEFAPGVIADSEAAIKKFTDKTLSGKLKEANVAAGEISKNSSAVRRKIRSSFARINEIREKNGKSKVNFVAQARATIEKKRNESFQKYKELFPAEYKYEKVRGGLGRYGQDDFSSGDSSSSKAQPVLAALKYNKAATGSGKGLGNGGKGEAKPAVFKGLNFEFDEGVDVDADYSGAGADAQALEALAKGAAEADKGRYRHQRVLSGDGSRDRDNNGINKDTKKNLFGIISSRYKKTAFPIFIGEQSMR